MSTAEGSRVATESVEQPAGGKLRADQLGIVELLFQSLASAAAGLSVTLALMAAIGDGGSTFSFITPLAYPLDVAGYIALGWLVLRIIYVAYVWRRYLERVHATEKIFLEEPNTARVTA